MYCASFSARKSDKTQSRVENYDGVGSYPASFSYIFTGSRIVFLKKSKEVSVCLVHEINSKLLQFY